MTFYDSNLQKEYTPPIKKYSQKRIEDILDFSDKVPAKIVDRLEMPMWLRGYTYLGSDYIAKNDRLHPDDSYKTDIHESIHTDDEYETRQLTELIISKISENYLIKKEREKTEKNNNLYK